MINYNEHQLIMINNWSIRIQYNGIIMLFKKITGHFEREKKIKLKIKK